MTIQEYSGPIFTRISMGISPFYFSILRFKAYSLSNNEVILSGIHHLAIFESKYIIFNIIRLENCTIYDFWISYHKSVFINPSQKFVRINLKVMKIKIWWHISAMTFQIIMLTCQIFVMNWHMHFFLRKKIFKKRVLSQLMLYR